jgi:hypothetical protein
MRVYFRSAFQDGKLVVSGYIMLFNQLLHNISTVARKIDLFSAIIHLPHLLLTSN